MCCEETEGVRDGSVERWSDDPRLGAGLRLGPLWRGRGPSAGPPRARSPGLQRRRLLEAAAARRVAARWRGLLKAAEAGLVAGLGESCLVGLGESAVTRRAAWRGDEWRSEATAA